MILVRDTPGTDADVLVMVNPPAHLPLPFPTREKESVTGYFFSGYRIFEI